MAAFGLWLLCGQSTSAHGRTGTIPEHIASDFSNNDPAPIERLIAAGLWEHVGEGYRMPQDPSNDPDQPLPVWRYGDDLDGHLITIDDTPNT
ncbi:hypothetical protein ACLBYD_30240 [Rhodococcus sp. C26F]